MKQPRMSLQASQAYVPPQPSDPLTGPIRQRVVFLPHPHLVHCLLNKPNGPSCSATENSSQQPWAISTHDRETSIEWWVLLFSPTRSWNIYSKASLQVVKYSTRDGQFSLGHHLLGVVYHRLNLFKDFAPASSWRAKAYTTTPTKIQMVVVMTILQEKALVAIMGTTIEEEEV